MTATELIKRHLAMAWVKVDAIIVTKKLLDQYKKENNLQHVKRKVWVDGVLLYTLKKLKP